MTLLPSGVKIHVALGVTDMRKGLDGLAMLVQGVLKRDPYGLEPRSAVGGAPAGAIGVLAGGRGPGGGGGRPSHMTGHMTVPMTKERSGSMAVLAAGAAGRRRFSDEDKRRIVDEASQPGCSVSQTARRYGIAVRVLFRWKEALKPEPVFAPVQVTDAATVADAPTAPSPGIEVELVGGRRVRFERDADPETIRRTVSLLEGGGQ